MRSGPILGWDIGGANVKAARLDPGTSLTGVRVLEYPFALWRNPEGLSRVLRVIGERFGVAEGVGAMAVTMTAELADCFATKREGVSSVLEAFRATFPAIEPMVYGVDGRFRPASEALRDPLGVAASNWVATATLVAQTYPDAIFLDAGSTTTDVIPLVGGRIAAVGKNDPERLAAGELVYTGVLRTPVCAILQRAPVAGQQCRVAGELFAIAADAHIWLGHISEKEYTCETPDGRGTGRADAGRRLARMVCADLETLTAPDITEIATSVATAQALHIRDAVHQVIGRLGGASPSVAVLGGKGAFLAHNALEGLRLRVFEMADRFGADAARVGPAAAVACLLDQAHGLEPSQRRVF